MSESEGFQVPRIPPGTFADVKEPDVGASLGLILGSAISALRDTGHSEDEIRHMVEAAFTSCRAVAAMYRERQARGKRP